MKAALPATPLFIAAKKIDFEDLIDMTAMVDIVFFLLIFFLVTSINRIDSSIPLPPPDPQQGAERKASTGSESLVDESSIVVKIDPRDTIWVDGVEVQNGQDFLFRLRELRNGPDRPENMLVVGSGDASHGTTVMVLDSGHEVGMAHVRLAIQDEEQ